MIDSNDPLPKPNLQAVKMTKMETLHSKQQNVLRRKMEEATALNKRLKDIMDKQKANSKFGKGGAGGAASNTGMLATHCCREFPFNDVRFQNRYTGWRVTFIRWFC